MPLLLFVHQENEVNRRIYYIIINYIISSSYVVAKFIFIGMSVQEKLCSEVAKGKGADPDNVRTLLKDNGDPNLRELVSMFVRFGNKLNLSRKIMVLV